MEPEVRYCITKDGVRIAYTVSGEGPPLLLCGEAVTSHVQLEWSHPPSSRLLHETARHNTVIRFDFRGCGLSDRVLGRSVDDSLSDMEAVVERTGLERFAISAQVTATLAAIAFAARHPDQVTRLVVIDGFARWGDLLNIPQVRALVAAAKVDWTLATEVIGFMSFGAGRDENQSHGEYIRACIGPDYFENSDVAATIDVTEFASQVKAPTLVMKHAGMQYPTMEMTKDLAARIPNAQLAVIEGTWADNIEATCRRVAAFVNDGETDVRPAPELPTGMTAILFADIADSTALTERLGDTRFREMARHLDAAMRTLIREHSGTPIEGKLLGDGVLAVFTSARQAIEAALACGSAGGEAGLPLHLGLHAGDVIREDNNVYGGAVNIAARISSLSTPGKVLVSDTVRSLARTSAGVSFDDRGEHALKGIEDPVRVYEVSVRA